MPTRRFTTDRLASAAAKALGEALGFVPTVMCIGAAMLAVLCVQGMSLLISVVTTRWAAIGITLAILFGASLLSGVVAGIISLIGSAESAHFLNYAFFNVPAPVGSIAPVFVNSATEVGKGMHEFGSEVATLAVWTVGFFAAVWFFLRRREEAG